MSTPNAEYFIYNFNRHYVIFIIGQTTYLLYKYQPKVVVRIDIIIKLKMLLCYSRYQEALCQVKTAGRKKILRTPMITVHRTFL